MVQISISALLGCVAPRIRYSIDDHPIPAMLAAKLGDALARREAVFSTSSSTANVTLILLDRTIDLPVTLMHDMHLQVL